MILSFIGDMTMEHSSGGNSTKALLASETENTQLGFRSDCMSVVLEAPNIAANFLGT